MEIMDHCELKVNSYMLLYRPSRSEISATAVSKVAAEDCIHLQTLLTACTEVICWGQGEPCVTDACPVLTARLPFLSRAGIQPTTRAEDDTLGKLTHITAHLGKGMNDEKQGRALCREANIQWMLFPMNARACPTQRGQCKGGKAQEDRGGGDRVGL